MKRARNLTGIRRLITCALVDGISDAFIGEETLDLQMLDPLEANKRQLAGFLEPIRGKWLFPA